MSPLDALLVEDNPGDARLVRHHLAGDMADAFFEDVRLDHVESLSTARDALGSASYDIVVLDLGLPESTGLDTLEAVRETDDETPVIVLTGHDDTAMATEAIKLGAQDYLPKDGLDADRLVRSLRYGVERHAQERLLERRNEQLDFFNGLLRHDMLNGLNIIMAQADLLEADLEDADHRDRARTIGEWSEDIAALADKIRRVLDTVEGDDASRESVSLADAVESQADRVRSVADRVSVEVDRPAESRVRANDLLDDVVGNLLLNAVEHTDGETRLSVTVRNTDRSAELRVADDGPGIPADRREAILERGERGDGSAGTGFGLYFVASMVESWGGTVRVTESEAGGAAIEVTLPRAG